MDNKFDAECLFVYGTCPDAEVGKAIARALLDARLVACVNLLPGMISLFRWDGKVEEAAEVAFIAKTSKSRMPAVKALFEKHHPYEEPALIALPVADGLPGFLSWVISETADPSPDAG
ncbi:divalent cation tolerance protein [Cohaesibacter sp. ES.047]|uniref:divalent-cation tolerance protein CutA n=1 Tax=Cohaesibacter sp. ES.047 TaxID=1798205 RepID=UPI000BBF9034|nr:divalent-cation tolerance protein CutA [Cohaesibacter sp. ES.047]SNY94158.1 divalent cation tolerance protein [Cohaesibacter sp. ES.047]